MAADTTSVSKKVHLSSIVITAGTMHQPVEFFHLHAGIADYFHHGGQQYQNFVLQPTKWISLYTGISIHLIFRIRFSFDQQIKNCMVWLHLFHKRQTRLDDFGSIPQCKLKNLRGRNEVSLSHARLPFKNV